MPNRKTYGQVWRSNPCMYFHPEKQGNWIARARLCMMQLDLQRHHHKITEDTFDEMVTLAKLAFPAMKPARIRLLARGLAFEFEEA